MKPTKKNLDLKNEKLKSLTGEQVKTVLGGWSATMSGASF